MDCEGEVNDFLLTTRDALAFTIRHRLRSVPPAPTEASIIDGDARKTTGTPGETVIDSNWKSFSGNPTGFFLPDLEGSGSIKRRY